jgi:DNA-binding transcriptional regulator LsrR (DeoR family)
MGTALNIITKIISLIAAIITSAISVLPTAFASTDVLENADCYDAGYEDGQDLPLDGGANDFCRQFIDDQGNPYYTSLIDGCMSVEGNTLDVCESATD